LSFAIHFLHLSLRGSENSNVKAVASLILNTTNPFSLLQQLQVAIVVVFVVGESHSFHFHFFPIFIYIVFPSLIWM
jgi:hypothetical protein